MANFMKYVDTNSYIDTSFYRVIDNFFVQGGGLHTYMTDDDDQPHALSHQVSFQLITYLNLLSLLLLSFFGKSLPIFLTTSEFPSAEIFDDLSNFISSSKR